jgi:hypothetical protein
MFASDVSVHQKMQVRLVRNWNDVAIKFFVLSNEICIGAIFQKKKTFLINLLAFRQTLKSGKFIEN